MTSGSPPADNLLGHSEAFKQATESYASGRMHHAWLLSGTEGIGKATLARQIATHIFMSVQNPGSRREIAERIERLIANETHPDLLIVRRATDEKTGETKKGIVIDDALKVGAFLRRTATHGGWRVVIIDEAHTLNRHAQNAILKILEEPPAHALIIMTATTPGLLLPTIRSRCRVLHLVSLSQDDMRSVLTRLQPSLQADEASRIIPLAGGSVGFALQILRSGALPLFDELVAIVGAPATDVQRLHKLADQISRKADTESFEVVVTLLGESLRASVRDAALLGLGRTVLEQRLQQWDKFRVTLDLAETANLDRKLAVINAVNELRAVS